MHVLMINHPSLFSHATIYFESSLSRSTPGKDFQSAYTSTIRAQWERGTQIQQSYSMSCLTQCTLPQTL